MNEDTNSLLDNTLTEERLVKYLQSVVSALNHSPPLAEYDDPDPPEEEFKLEGPSPPRLPVEAAREAQLEACQSARKGCRKSRKPKKDSIRMACRIKNVYSLRSRQQEASQSQKLKVSGYIEQHAANKKSKPITIESTADEIFLRGICPSLQIDDFPNLLS